MKLIKFWPKGGDLEELSKKGLVRHGLKFGAEVEMDVPTFKLSDQDAERMSAQTELFTEKATNKTKERKNLSSKLKIEKTTNDEEDEQLDDIEEEF